MIEGVLRHDTDMDIQKSYTDSHGQSEVGFAFCHLLGFELLPRLKAIASQKLYLPETDSSGNYPNLTEILTRPIKWDLIRQQYDEMIKYATALRLGTAEADVILRRFTRGNLQQPTYQALAELGKVLKTIFLCRYIDSEELRREIHEGLNVVEEWRSRQQSAGRPGTVGIVAALVAALPGVRQYLDDSARTVREVVEHEDERG